ncbi:MAG: flavin reductase family protein [Xanthobacteraceae bacterium]
MNMRADPSGFRSAAARFLTGVTVVASRSRDGERVGMTANSFTSVSMKPPTVLVSLMRGRTWQAIMDCGCYSVNVMHAEDVASCVHFAGKPQGNATALIEMDGFPVLPHAIARFACDVVRTIDVADHTLFIGEVRWCRHQDGSPLGFFGNQFRHGTGAAIAPTEIPYPPDEWAI